MTELKVILRQIAPLDTACMDRARERQEMLAKPPGSLGKLERYAVRLAGIRGAICPRVEKCRVLVFAADNGVVAEGVSSAPSSVTLSQVVNMTRHVTGMSALAHYFGDEVVIADVGIDTDAPIPNVRNEKIRRSTGNIAKEPAMTRAQALAAVDVGIRLAQEAARDGVDAVGVGEMGIGNTTTSAAVLAALTGRAPETLAGRGGGLTDAAFARKKRVLAQALALHRPQADDPIGVLAAVGGLDLAAMTGAFLGCAAQRVPAVVDGFISVVAALCAVRLCPQARDYLFLSHASYELGYRVAAQALDMEPCLLLDMRLGEGSGCPIFFQILKAACAAANGMATFREAQIADDYLAPIRADDCFTVR